MNELQTTAGNPFPVYELRGIENRGGGGGIPYRLGFDTVARIAPVEMPPSTSSVCPVT